MQRGITLVEVMLLLIIGVVIVLVAFPNLIRGRRTVGGVNVIGAMKSYCTAQTTYLVSNYSSLAHSGDPAWQKCYAPSWQNLGGAHAHKNEDGNKLALIPDVFADASAPPFAYLGYFFCDVPIDAWGTPFGNSNYRYGHGLSAIPAVYDRSGVNTWAVGVEGTVYMKDFGAQGSAGQVKRMSDPATDPAWIAP